MQVSQAQFEKHDYGNAKKYSVESLESFDPQPKELQNTCSQRLPQLLSDVKGKGLCVSLLLDSSVCVNATNEKLTKTELLKKVEAFKKKASVD